MEHNKPSQILERPQSIEEASKMNFSSNRRNNQASSTMIPQHRRNEEGRISIGAVGGRQQAQIALDTPTTTQNIKSAPCLNNMKAGIESLKINSTTSGSAAIASPKKLSPPSASHKCSSNSDGQDDDDGLAATRQLLGHRQANTVSSETDTDSADASNSEHTKKGQVFEKLGAFVQERKDAPDEAAVLRMTPPPEAEVSLTLNDMRSAPSEAVLAAANNEAIEEPRSSRRISFSRLDDIVDSDDDNDDDDSDDDKSMTLDDLMELSTNDRASPSSAPTSVPDLIRSSAQTTTNPTTPGAEYEVSIEAPLREEGSSSRRSSAISFECHDSVLLDLLSQEISDNEDDIDPRRNPSFYNESIGAPNVLSRMDQSILAREVSNGRLARDGMHFSFSHGLNLDE